MRALLVTLLICCSVVSFCQSLPTADKIRIREGMNIAGQYADQLFPNFQKAPFAVLLVTDSVEFLVNHPRPSNDFHSIGFDSILNTTLFSRPRVFNKNLLATFPAVNGISCIVIGTPANTNKTSSEWVITLLHEHFHQYQSSQPGYYDSVDSLDLSGGDQTGMWMLNYPFPYDSLPINQQYEQYAKALYDAIRASDKDFAKAAEKCAISRQAFLSMLKSKDARYFLFQIWQEGLARHTEYSFLQRMRSYQPSADFAGLPDYLSFHQLAQNMYERETTNLIKQKLSENQRVSFYSNGFAEGELLNRINKDWRDQYLIQKFRLPLVSLP